MKENIKTDKQVVRINGRLKEILVIKDHAGNVIHKILSPLMIEFYPRDVVQVIVGAALLAIPVSFTEEVWELGSSLPQNNVYGIAVISALFMSIFVYYNFYRNNLRSNVGQFLKRIISTYVIAFLVVALILTVLQLAPWQTDLQLAINRVILVTFPASLSGAIADMLK
ncbi:DUF2391 family protein [Candidatus Peregrinibacteria bacterium]|nr:DUF2391 family protein [Candidatus Peregrinibacteria bacterium]MBT4148450.1 DUF2391 family protein [Candidatus Peregrinibacteria bacterium]MBT4366543.1 DUF2391 family protein [Candidatus Peregrinibacteria bacterium]MBT4456491.1 DUF2391 family protein [Candidatus Peregrinibacteria bacterium]